MSDPLAFPEYTDPVELTPAPAGGMNRSDAWERFAQCRRLQPDALQVLVSADIVDALLRAVRCDACKGTGLHVYQTAYDRRVGESRWYHEPCPSCAGSGNNPEEAA